MLRTTMLPGSALRVAAIPAVSGRMARLRSMVSVPARRSSGAVSTPMSPASGS